MKSSIIPNRWHRPEAELIITAAVALIAPPIIRMSICLSKVEGECQLVRRLHGKSELQHDL